MKTAAAVALGEKPVGTDSSVENKANNLHYSLLCHYVSLTGTV